MVTIELTKRDAVMLGETLQSLLADMKAERVRTDNRALHADLVQRETLVGEVIRQLDKHQEAA